MDAALSCKAGARQTFVMREGASRKERGMKASLKKTEGTKEKRQERISTDLSSLWSVRDSQEGRTDFSF